jgi:hypothetical protein
VQVLPGEGHDSELTSADPRLFRAVGPAAGSVGFHVPLFSVVTNPWR